MRSKKLAGEERDRHGNSEREEADKVWESERAKHQNPRTEGEGSEHKIQSTTDST